jgi:CubicO group peptidase (beta-lactamase class C family)
MNTQTKLDNYTTDYMAQEIGPGINLAFFDGSQWHSSSRGFIDDRNIPTSPETFYDIASITKSVVATYICCHLNNDTGPALNLHTDLEWFLGWQGPAGKIKIFDLLTHRSGLQWTNNFKTWLHEEKTKSMRNQDVEQFLLNKENYIIKDFRKTQYMCINYIILGKYLNSGFVDGQNLEDKISGLLNTYNIGELMYKPLENGIKKDQIAKTETHYFDGSPAEIGIVQDEKARYLGGVSGNAGMFASLLGLQNYATAWLERRFDFGNWFQQDIYDMAYTPMGYGNPETSEIYTTENKPVLNNYLQQHFGLVWRRGGPSLHPNITGWCGPAMILNFEKNQAIVHTSNNTFPVRSEERRAKNLMWNRSLNELFDLN